MTLQSRTLCASACFAAILGLAACETTSAPAIMTSATAEMPSPVGMELKTGEVLQFALVKPRDGDAAKAVRERYFQTAIPYAQTLGDRALGNFRIRNTLLGDNKPVVMAVYAFPTETAMETFQSSPNFEEYKRMRVEGWEELHVFSATLPADMTLSFDPTKTYTLAAAWTNPGTMPAYQRYLDGIEPDFDEIGARYVAQLRDIDLQSQTDDAGDPSQITIVEWSKGKPDLAGLARTQGYKDNQNNFRSAIRRFDLYWFETTGR